MKRCDFLLTGLLLVGGFIGFFAPTGAKAVAADKCHLGISELVVGYIPQEPFLFKGKSLGNTEGLDFQVFSALGDKCGVRVRYQALKESQIQPLTPDNTDAVFVPPHGVHVIAGGIPRISRLSPYYATVTYLEGGPSIAVREEVNITALLVALMNNVGTIAIVFGVIGLLFLFGTVGMHLLDRVPLLVTKNRWLLWFLDLGRPKDHNLEQKTQIEEHGAYDIGQSYSCSTQCATTQGFGDNPPRNLVSLTFGAVLAILFAVISSVFPSIWNQIWEEAQNSRSIGTLDDLSTKVVGAMDGSRASELITEKAGQLVTTADIPSALGVLKRGGVDVVVGDGRLLSYYARNEKGIVVVPGKYADQTYAYLIPRTLPPSVQVGLDVTITHIVESPEFQRWESDTFQKRR